MKTIILIVVVVTAGIVVSGCSTNASVGTPGHGVSVGASAR